jgi:RNA polymerase sigma factor (sigma-70 family)
MRTFADEYDRIIQPMEDRIIRCIWRIVRNEHDAQDALQNALAAVWKRRKRVFTHPNPPALILRMCINSAHDVLRSRLRRKRTEESASTVNRQETLSPLQSMIRQEQLGRVVDAVGQLSRKQSADVVLRLLEQMPYDQIASSLNCSETTARVHVQKGREALRRRLMNYQPAEGR